MPENVELTKNYNFTIYISSNFPTQMPDTKFFPTTPKPSKDNYEGYAKDGFAVLQYYLSQFVLSRELKGNAPIVEIAMVEGKTQAYTQNDFMDNIGPSLALFILLIFIAPQYRFIGMVTVEKASRAREGKINLTQLKTYNNLQKWRFSLLKFRSSCSYSTKCWWLYLHIVHPHYSVKIYQFTTCSLELCTSLY